MPGVAPEWRLSQERRTTLPSSRRAIDWPLSTKDWYTTLKCFTLLDSLQQIKKVEDLYGSRRFSQRRCDIRSLECRSAASARFIVGLLRPDFGMVFLVTEHGIWPSSENNYLFNLLRETSGVMAGLADLPGHVFDQSEVELLTCYLQIAMISGWGGVLWSKFDSSFVFISHDSWIVVGSAMKADELDGKLVKFGLTPEIFTGSLETLVSMSGRLN